MIIKLRCIKYQDVVYYLHKYNKHETNTRNQNIKKQNPPAEQEMYFCLKKSVVSHHFSDNIINLRGNVKKMLLGTGYDRGTKKSINDDILEQTDSSVYPYNIATCIID